MSSFRQTQEGLLFAFDDGDINGEEFLLLLALKICKNLDYPYWKYQAFDLDQLSDDECRTYFKFYKSNIDLLIENLQIPWEIMCFMAQFSVDWKHFASFSNVLLIFADTLMLYLYLVDLCLSYWWLAITC